MSKLVCLVLSGVLLVAPSCASHPPERTLVWEDGYASYGHPGITFGPQLSLAEARELAAADGPEGRAWRAFERRIRRSDTLYWYETDAESWQQMAGRAGIAIVRGNVVVDEFEVYMN